MGCKIIQKLYFGPYFRTGSQQNNFHKFNFNLSNKRLCNKTQIQFVVNFMNQTNSYLKNLKNSTIVRNYIASPKEIEIIVENELKNLKHLNYNPQIYTMISRKTLLSRQKTIQLVRKINNRNKRQIIKDIHRKKVIKFIYDNNYNFQNLKQIYDALEKILPHSRHQLYSLVRFAKRRLYWKTPTEMQRNIISQAIRNLSNNSIDSSTFYNNLEYKTGLSREQLYHLVKSEKSHSKKQNSQKITSFYLKALLYELPIENILMTMKDNTTENSEILIKNSLENILKNKELNSSINSELLDINELKSRIFNKYINLINKKSITPKIKDLIKNIIQKNPHANNDEIYEQIESISSTSRSALYHIVRISKRDTILKQLTINEKKLIKNILQTYNLNTPINCNNYNISNEENILNENLKKDSEKIINEIINHTSLSKEDAQFIYRSWKPIKYISKKLSKEEKMQIEDYLKYTLEKKSNEYQLKSFSTSFKDQISNKIDYSFIYSYLQQSFGVSRSQATNIVHDYIDKLDSKIISKEIKLLSSEIIENWKSITNPEKMKDRNKLKQLYDELQEKTNLSRKQVRAQVFKKLNSK